MRRINKIGVFTSGGDAPGMNAAIRAVVRTALYKNIEVIGIYRGFQGMIEKNFISMDRRSVSSIIQMGGTILKSARCLEFHTKDGRIKAYNNLKKEGIDSLISIGGDGTFTGTNIFAKEFDFPVMCIPGTIDNDLFGSDYTLGYDTANNTVIEAIDKIRDTASSHSRLFFVEVMGRDSGCIALHAGIGGGAEAILLPEFDSGIEQLVKEIELAEHRQKTSMIVIIAEGDKNGGVAKVSKIVKEKFPHLDIKVSILGHLQRGGSPSSFDRVLATRMGYSAVNELLKGNTRATVGLRGTKIVTTPLEIAIGNQEFKLDEELLQIANVMNK